MNKTSRRRFIAGATCPQCGEIDKVFTQIRTKQARPCESEGTGNNDVGSTGSTDTVEEKERGCVSCDFLEVISDLEQEPAPVVTGEWSPVKLL